MQYLTARFVIALVTFLVGLIATSLFLSYSSKSTEKMQSRVALQVAPLATQTAFSEQQDVTEPASPIRSVDFANSTYPWTKDLINPEDTRRTFTIINGELPATRDNKGFIDEMGVHLGKVAFGDVTNDGNEEALVSLGIQTGGSSIPGIVYIYAWDKRRLKLLWSFTTGDRADGGMRDVYAENGDLVVELKGKNKFIGGDLYAEDETSQGDCCPTLFTRARYKWRGNRFRLKEKPDVLPINQP